LRNYNLTENDLTEVLGNILSRRNYNE
jgi:hypothetical protein